ncbi:MAG: tyrosine-type recombinase/integrase, partial [Segetibacter sp.]
MPYKPAKLYSAKGDLTKEWYVEYFFQVPGDFLTYKRFKVRFNLNRQGTLADRLAYGKDLEKFWNEKLRSGFNPFMAFKFTNPQSGLTILKQLEYIVNELCDAETKSAKHTFNSHYNRFEKYVVESSFTDMSFAYFGKNHCEGYKTWMKKKSLSRKTINSSLSYMSRFFKLAINKEWLIDNHMKNVEQIKEREYRTDIAKRERFDPINGNEMDLIFQSLREKKEHSFIAFLAVIYYAWIRPVEILRLKIGDIDLKRSVIKLKKNDTKNNMGAHVQIVPPL